MKYPKRRTSNRAISRIISKLLGGAVMVRAAVIFAALAVMFAALAALAQAYSGGTSGAVRETLLFDAKNYISVAVTSVDTDILLYDGEMIKLVYVGENRIRTSENSYSLTVQQDDSFALSVLAPEMFSYKLTIYLPEMRFKEVKVTSASGSVLCEGFDAEMIIVTTRSGDITFRDAGSMSTLIMPETATGKISY